MQHPQRKRNHDGLDPEEDRQRRPEEAVRHSSVQPKDLGERRHRRQQPTHVKLVDDRRRPEAVLGAGRVRAAAEEAVGGRPSQVLDLRRRPQREHDQPHGWDEGLR